MYYKTPTNALYWYDSGVPITGLPDGSMPLTNDEARAFVGCELHSPSPFPSWVLHESEAYWQAPTPMPTDDKMYDWDEAALAWIKVTI